MHTDDMIVYSRVVEGALVNLSHGLAKVTGYFLWEQTTTQIRLHEDHCHQPAK